MLKQLTSPRPSLLVVSVAELGQSAIAPGVGHSIARSHPRLCPRDGPRQV